MELWTCATSDRSQLFEHNPTVTLMRTNADESKAIGESIVNKVRTYTKDKSQLQVILPLGGVSIIATPGAPFHDSSADEALFSALRNGLKDFGVEVVEDERAINDEDFALDVAKRLVSIMQL